MTTPNHSPQNDANGRRSDSAGHGLYGGQAGGEQIEALKRRK